MAELLRPPRRHSWRARLAMATAGVTPLLVLTSAGAVLLVAVTAWWLLRSPAPPVERSLPLAASVPTPAAATTAATTAPVDVVVQAAGAVAAPGVYHVRSGARVVDVITAAGGATADADLQAVALAARVTDGARVYVPRAGETAPSAEVAAGGGPAASGPGPPAGPVDLNQASVEQLDVLPGVGPSIAQAIVNYRAEHGPFASVDDLLDVRGIGPAKLDALRPQVTVG